MKYHLWVIGAILVVYFFFRWIMPFFFSGKRFCNQLSFVAVIPVAIVLYGYAYFRAAFIEPEWKNQKFDKVLWHTEPHSRYTMANDLINSRQLIAKDTSYVRTLLGSPSLGQSSFWSYNMGTSGWGFGWGFHSLSIEILNGRVAEVKWGTAID